MATLKSTFAASEGAGKLLLVENDVGGNAPVQFVYPGRMIPVAQTFANCSLSITTVVVDLLTKKPSGATFARLALKAGGGDLSFWDNGLDPTTDGEGQVIAAGDWFDVPNLNELTSFKMKSTSATAALLRVAWYKTS